MPAKQFFNPADPFPRKEQRHTFFIVSFLRPESQILLEILYNTIAKNYNNLTNFPGFNFNNNPISIQILDIILFKVDSKPPFMIIKISYSEAAI